MKLTYLESYRELTLHVDTADKTTQTHDLDPEKKYEGVMRVFVNLDADGNLVSIDFMSPDEDVVKLIQGVEWL